MLLFFFKIINNMVPDYLQELKPDRKQNQAVVFHNKHDFVLQDWRLMKYLTSFCHMPFLFGISWTKMQLLQNFQSLSIKNSM